MPTTEDLLAQLVALSGEQLRWQRAAALPGLRAVIERTLATSQQRKAYELCDGKTLSSDIAKKVGTSPQNLSSWTRRWRDLGIAHEEGQRIKHLAPLRSLGIVIELDGS